jgi:cyclophilin family peptidyl-prolyl cis-trans isomerase
MSWIRIGPLLAVALAAAAPATFAQTKPAGSAAARPATAKPEPVAPGTEAVVSTPKGEFTIRLLPELAPRHVAYFVATARAGGYDATTFHRLIAGGIIQGGDPLSKDPGKVAQYGTGGLGVLRAELSDRPFVRGTVAAVRRPSDMNSAGRQFFVCLRDQPALKGQFSIFGEVVSGMEVVDQISLVPVAGDRATERVEMKILIREPAAPEPVP